jgi:hypothetical protein
LYVSLLFLLFCYILNEILFGFFYHSALCAKVKLHDKAQVDKLLPLLNKRLSKAAQSSADCIHVKDCVQSW